MASRENGIKKDYILLLLVGICLSIAQFVMIRDFVTILYGEEVVIVLVTAAFFSGLSLGYLLSLKFSRKVFEISFLVSVFLHLTFPFSYRYLAAGISTLDNEGVWYMVLMFGYAFVFSSIFATFLPRLAAQNDSDMSPEQRLKILYSVELLGFALGFTIVGWSWNQPLSHLLPVYWFILGIILHLTLRKKAVSAAFFLTVFVAVTFLDPMDKQSTAILYKMKHGKKNPRVLLSINSAYQKVEVIEDARGKRYLYLDGLQNLNAGDLKELNYYIAEVPASLVRPRKTLLVGNGTLSSVPKVYPFSGDVVSVELDSGVLLAGQKAFTPPESLASLDRWRLIVDDGKHFLRSNRETFDLIIMDIPSPLTIQEALLHTVEFYELASRRLSPEGVISIQLSGPLARNNRTPARVVAALNKVFREVMVIYSKKADRGFAYASNHLPFTEEQCLSVTRDHEKRLKIIPRNKVSSYLKKATPLATDNLDLVLRRGLERFLDRYFDYD
ncbi:MAG: hypothetical protein ACE5E9_09820 [Nitrospinaceae bacterium]